MGAAQPDVRAATLAIGPDEVCHLLPVDGETAFCGYHVPEAEMCGFYYSVPPALCPGCGLPICPLCVRLDALDAALESA